MSLGRSVGTETVAENGSQHCWDTMKTEVMDHCAPCSQFDAVSQIFILFSTYQIN